MQAVGTDRDTVEFIYISIYILYHYTLIVQTQNQFILYQCIYLSYIQILKNQKGNNQTWQETLKDQQYLLMLLLLIVTLLLNLRITALDLRNRELSLREV